MSNVDDTVMEKASVEAAEYAAGDKVVVTNGRRTVHFTIDPDDPDPMATVRSIEATINEESPEDAQALDSLAQRVESLARHCESLEKRLRVSETAIKGLLEAVTGSEDLHELRVVKILAGFFGGMNSSLQESMNHMLEEVSVRRHGFTVELVDGVIVKPDENTILARKRADGGIDFSGVNTPDEIQNHGTEPFAEYLKRHDHLFDGQEAILINIRTTRQALAAVEGTTDEQAAS